MGKPSGCFCRKVLHKRLRMILGVVSLKDGWMEPWKCVGTFQFPEKRNPHRFPTQAPGLLRNATAVCPCCGKQWAKIELSQTSATPDHPKWSNIHHRNCPACGPATLLHLYSHPHLHELSPSLLKWELEQASRDPKKWLQTAWWAGILNRSPQQRGTL